jgi:hypothetical protein
LLKIYGGVLMKLSSLFVAGTLIAALAFAVPAAKADGVEDPNITIGSGHGSIPTTAGGSDLDPIQTTDDNDGVVFCYGVLNNEGACTATAGLPALSAVYVEVTAYTGENPTFFQSESWTCTPGDGATSCGTAPVCNSAQMGEVNCPSPAQSAFEFVFFATSATGAPVDFFQPGEEVTVYTPEPAALLLLLLGIGAVVALGLRRRQAFYIS